MMEELVQYPPYVLTSWAGVVGLAVMFVFRPLTSWWIASRNGTDTKAHARLERIETNDIKHIEQHLEQLDENVDYLRQEYGKIRERIAVLEILIKK